ncbi:hypothetical protein [Actibacterium mucosum]|nr:hypothetical protein [Actibacterium mucosum]
MKHPVVSLFASIIGFVLYMATTFSMMHSDSVIISWVGTGMNGMGMVIIFPLCFLLLKLLESFVNSINKG